ncbi:MAG: alpha-amylase family glycosyl hydrolase [Prevotellaceae bacterium]|nr:alpha-amylase family glycosyl hydrolase [Prevotellaceae bacterium]
MNLRRIYSLLVVLATVSLCCKAEVHPLHWYAGMKNPMLQVMIHETNVGNSDVELIGAQGLTITEVKSFCNPNYLIIYIDTKDAAPQKFTIQLSGKGKKAKARKFAYELKARSGYYRGSWDASDVVYLLMPDRFAKGYSDAQKQKMFRGMKEDKWNEEDFGRRGGDIQGMIDHLDYLEELGITAIWPTPMLVNDMPRESYHGYAITDYYQTDPRFGSNEDYCRWIDECHRRGIKVIQDIVFNHCGSGNFLFYDRPDSTWFHYNSHFRQSIYKTGSVTDPYVSDIDKDLTINGWFTEAMPDVNESNKYFADYLIQASKWWVEYAHIDGVRQDTYPYNDFDFMAHWCKEMDEEYPGFNIVGETWVNNNVAVSYWQKGSVLSPANSYLPTVMDFPLMALLNKVVDEETDSWDYGFARLYEYLSQDFIYADCSHLLTFLANHDTNRFQPDEQKAQNITRYRQALTLLLTLRGIPQLYYGDELGMVANKGMGDGGMRKIVPTSAFTAEGRTDVQNEYFNFTKKLLNWRKGNNVIAYGTTKQYAIRDGVYVYARQYKGRMVTVMLNGTSKPANLAMDTYKEVIRPEMHDVISDKNIVIKDSLQFAPRQIYVLE